MRLKVLQAIESFISEKGYSPTYREIAELVGLKSAATVKWHISYLVRDGAITLQGGRRRTIRLVRNP